jgi:hypothetical protein
MSTLSVRSSPYGLGEGSLRIVIPNFDFDHLASDDHEVDAESQDQQAVHDHNEACPSWLDVGLHVPDAAAKKWSTETHISTGFDY